MHTPCTRPRPGYRSLVLGTHRAHAPGQSGYRSLVLGCVARMLCLRQRQRRDCCVAPQLHRHPEDDDEGGAPLEMPNMDEADAVIAQLERAAARIPPPRQ